MLQLLVQHSGDIVLLKCKGRMVAGDGLKALQRTATAKRASGLVIDLGEVESLDAAGLGTLLRVRQWCNTQGMSLQLINPNKQAREVLAMTALDSVLEVHPKSEADVEGLQREWACAEN
jgi:anti-anti-sigma factor